jgi:outer membrane protein OmpA-like peptidoglycan-associated protein
MAWVAMLAAASAGCASKGHVSREVGEVNQKVEDLSDEVERTQDRVRQNEGRLDGLDSDVADAKGSAGAAMERATAAEKLARGKLIYTVTLSNDKVRFPTNRAELSDEGRAMIDEAVVPLKEANRSVYFEVEGHTDATGPEEYNKRLGLERAQAVRDYLYTAHGIPLSRIEVISFGEAQPVVDNSTAENRAQNRRVVIKILE